MEKGCLKRAMGLLLAALLVVMAFPYAALAAPYDANYPANLTGEHLKATSAILIQADTGEVLFEKDADKVMYPASTTKIMTALLAILYGADNWDQPVTISQNALNVPSDSSTIGLTVGEEIKLKDLVYATMVASGNDGAIAIAEAVAGDVPTFVSWMNEYARILGCTSTNFVNPHGYHDDNHVTTVRDMMIIARAAMQNEIFRDIVKRNSYTLPKNNINRQRGVSGANYFIYSSENHTKEYYPEGTGVKTGYHSLAGSCYVGSASRGGVNLISVVFNSSSNSERFIDTIKLMEYGFAQYKSTTIREIYAENPKIIDISKFAKDDPQVGRLELSLRKVDPNANDAFVTTPKQYEYYKQSLFSLTQTEFTHVFEAPIYAGDVMGTMTYYDADGNAVLFELIATRSIELREPLMPSLADIIAAVEADENPFPDITVELVMVYFVLPVGCVYILFRLLRYGWNKAHKRVRVKTIEPTERYYR